MQELIEKAIKAAAQNIIQYIEMEMSPEWAIDQFRSKTSFGPKSIDAVMAIVNEYLDEKEQAR